MVEAGGTERAFEYFEKGAHCDEDVIANGLESPRRGSGSRSSCRESWVRKAGSKETIDFVLFVD